MRAQTLRILPLVLTFAACSGPDSPTGPLPEKGITPVTGDEGRPIKPQRIDLLEGSSLVSALRGGGHVIFFRHFHSDHSVWHEDPIKPKHAEMTAADIRGSCEEQRPLSEYGRKKAKAVGEAMRKLEVPIGSVFASPYCRVIESANLVANRPPDAILYDLMHRGGGYTEPMQNRNIRPYLSQVPKSGTNTLLMAHRVQMDYIKFAEEGEAFVFLPKGNGEFDLVGTIYDNEWLEALVDPDLLGSKVFQKGGDAPSRDKNKILPTAIAGITAAPTAPAPAISPAPAPDAPPAEKTK